MKLKSILLFFLSFIILSCSDESIYIPDLPQSGGILEKGNSITGTVFGHVYNEANSPIDGATVKVGNKTTQTNSDGLYVLSNIPLFELRNVIQINSKSSPTYFSTFSSINGKANQLNAVLKPFSTLGSFSNQTGGTFTTNDFSIEFPQQSIPNYSGDVIIKYHFSSVQNIEENNPLNIYEVFGENEGLLTDYKKFTIRLEDQSGNKLNFDTTKTAVITTNSESSGLDIFHFNEDDGYWENDGDIVEVNGEISLLVNHFSSWGIGYVALGECATFRIINNATGQEYKENMKIDIIANTTDGKRFTNSLYRYSPFRLCFPENTISFEMSFNHPEIFSIENCGLGEYVSSSFQGGENDILLDLNSHTYVETSGTITSCENEPIEQGLFELRRPDGVSYTEFFQNGQLDFSRLVCGSATDIYTLKALDLSTGLFTGQVSTSIADFPSILSLQACEDNFEEVIWEGNLNYREDQVDDINEFFDGGYNVINGNLNVGTLSGSAGWGVSDISKLINLRTVHGNVEIHLNASADSVVGLKNLESVGGDVLNIDKSSFGSQTLFVEGLSDLNIEFNGTYLFLSGFYNNTDYGNLNFTGSSTRVRMDNIGFMDLDFLDTFDIVELSIDTFPNLTTLSNLNYSTSTEAWKIINISSCENLSDLGSLLQNTTTIFEIGLSYLPVLNLTEVELLNDRMGVVKFSDIPSLQKIRLPNLTLMKNSSDEETSFELIDLENLTEVYSPLFKEVENSVFGDVDSRINFLNLPQLVNYNFLSNLEEIRSISLGELEIENLDFLDTEIEIRESAIFHNNPNLKDYCAISNNYTGFNPPYFEAEGNSYNPTYQQIEDGECSQ